MMREPTGRGGRRRSRSPESSRRRRAERRTSREQLAAAAAAAVAIPPQQYQQQPPSHQQYNRSRSGSATSSSSSTSSSLLNISRNTRRFGFRSFFTRSSSKNRVRKRRSFRNKNSSSSSVDSDLAYGRGYVSRRSFEGRDVPATQQNEPPLFEPDGRPALRRAQTDEEILELGRKISEMARAENIKDLERAGRKRPSQIMAAATAISHFRRQGTGDSARGIASSRPHRESDESDWESTSSDDDSFSSDDADSGLAYGFAHHSNPHLPPSSSHHPPPFQQGPPTIVSERPPEAIRPPDRKSSAVDPALFGPVNSLRGYINTPCGFRPGELPPSQVHQPFHRYNEPIPQPSSASIEARPMQRVYPVPTSDPGKFEPVASSSMVSGPSYHTATGSTRPMPVPIQPVMDIHAPKPRVDLRSTPRVLEEQRIAEEQRARESRSSGHRPPENMSIPDAALVGAAAASVVGAAVQGSGRKSRREDNQRERDVEEPRVREETERRFREEQERREQETRHLQEETERMREEAEHVRNEQERRDQEARRQREEQDRLHREDLERRVREEREVRYKEERRVQDEQGRALREADKKRERDEKRKMESTPQEKHEGDKDRDHDRRSKRDNERAVSSSDMPIDPFQFQVPNDAFQTPIYGSATPTRPLTPQVFTVDREPKFDDDDHEHEGLKPDEEDERRSRRDSFEDELRRARSVMDETTHSTISAKPEVIATAVSVVQAEEREYGKHRGRDPEPVRDPVLEEANRHYREKMIARKIAEEQIRSRSASPEPSVVEKWNDVEEEPVVRIVTPPEMDRPHKKSEYDAPNADVRIDNVIMPRGLIYFRTP
ncbi:hypothetical protein QBC46DRAFT_314531, partial [Diplogelasinospora grovesii]